MTSLYEKKMVTQDKLTAQGKWLETQISIVFFHLCHTVLNALEPLLGPRYLIYFNAPMSCY